MNTEKKIIFASAAAILFSGCTTDSILEEPGDSTFGEANRQTMMAQVVNPEPVYVDPMTTSGEHAADAIERYRNNDVPDPTGESTTSGVTGGSGGGGSGGN